jgi:hypothetical protein
MNSVSLNKIDYTKHIFYQSGNTIFGGEGRWQKTAVQIAAQKLQGSIHKGLGKMEHLLLIQKAN